MGKYIKPECRTIRVAPNLMLSVSGLDGDGFSLMDYHQESEGKDEYFNSVWND